MPVDASGWGWALLQRARRNGAAATSRRSHCSLAVATNPMQEEDDFLDGPVDLPSPDSAHAEAHSLLEAWGWAPVGSWRQVDLSLLVQGGFTWWDGEPADVSDPREIARVRQVGLGNPGVAPVPYGSKATWAFNDPSDYGEAFWNDSSWEGPAPGWVLSALRTIDGAVERPTDRTEPPGFVDQWLAGAEEAVIRFDDWLWEEISGHGWPRAGVDSEHLTELVLNWVIGHARPDRRDGFRRALASRVAEGDADPDLLAALDTVRR